MEIGGSELGGQDGLAESELKCWLSIDRNIEDLYWKLKDLSYADKTESQNLSLNLGSLLTGICEDLYWKLKDLS